MHVITYRGLKVHLGTREDAFREITKLLEAGGRHQIVTLNPEYVVLASRNNALVDISQCAALCLVDGIGLAFALRQFGKSERYPGADLVPELSKYCNTQHYKLGVVLLPGGLSTPTRVHEAFTKKFPGLAVEAWYADEMVLENIQKFQPLVLLVALGQPQQDFWIAKHLPALPSVRVAIGVGGAIDFLTEARRRAPRLMRHIGLEWLWRVVTQPKRIARIFRATFGFWYTILFS